MNYNIPFFTNPFTWVILAGIFLAASISRITISTKKKSDPVKAKQVKWILVFIYLSLSILSGLAAIFIPGAQYFKDIRLLFCFAGAFVLFFFVFRFKKSVGLPFAFVLIVITVLLFLFFQSIVAFTGETALGTIRVLDTKDNRMKLEFEDNKGIVQFEMEGQYFAPVVKTIIFNDYIVFLGAKTWYRFDGLSSYKIEAGNSILKQADRFPFPRPEGISEKMYRFFEQNEKTLPLVKSVQISVEQKLAKKSESYLLMLQNDGGIEIVNKSKYPDKK